MNQIANNASYNLFAENEITYLLSHFNSQYIFDVIEDNIQNNNNCFDIVPLPNVVASFEENFKYLSNKYPSDISNIQSIRTETYREIIQLLCTKFNLQFIDTGDIEYFSVAYYLYDFLVANFNINIVTFFSNFIYREKNSLYESLNMEAYKKNKDSSTIYGKKMYKDIKLAVLNANLEYIINNLKTFDFDLTTILSTIYYSNKNIASFISSLVLPVGNFYIDVYCSTILKPDQLPIFLTGIRLNIQRNYIADSTDTNTLASAT